MAWSYDDPREAHKDACLWLVVAVRVPGQEFKAWLVLLETTYERYHVYGPDPDKTLDNTEWWPEHWAWTSAP